MDSLDRTLGSPRPPRRLFLLKLLAIVVGVVLVGVLVSRLNLRRDLSRLDAGFLAGSEKGNYYRIVENLRELAARRGGTIRTLTSSGSGENVQRLVSSVGDCSAKYALVQAGTEGLTHPKLRLIGRFWKAESIFFLGKNADAITSFAQLERLRIGIGPERSGTAQVMQQLLDLPELKRLRVRTSYHRMSEQLELAAEGKLDLAVFVLDEDAPLIRRAVVDKGLQIAGFSHADVIARRMPHLRHGRIGAGQYDAVKLLPPGDRRVLRVDTLVVGNGCGGRSQSIDLLIVLAELFPNFVRHNRVTPNATGVPYAKAARSFYEQGGPELADEYAPWLVDVMPPANWVYVVMAVSLLFNAMAFAHRFRLWRVDASRVDLEARLSVIFGPHHTLGEIARDVDQPTPARERLHSVDGRAAVQSLCADLEALLLRSRRYALSILVPMGQEMAYRYQEELIAETLGFLRDLLRRSPPGSAEQKDPPLPASN